MTSNKNWLKYAYEFLCIFVAVVAAFTLNNWNENRKFRNAESKILVEIDNGLKKDLFDISMNIKGHEGGIKTCKRFQDLVLGKTALIDSLPQNYFNLTRDFISIQNISGYESLKAKGLELVRDDSLRKLIIDLYEFDYEILKKLEEDYGESQFHNNYFNEINNIMSEDFTFDDNGNIDKLKTPLSISEQEKNKLLIYLWKIKANREYNLMFNKMVIKKIEKLQASIKKEID